MSDTKLVQLLKNQDGTVEIGLLTSEVKGDTLTTVSNVSF